METKSPLRQCPASLGHEETKSPLRQCPASLGHEETKSPLRQCPASLGHEETKSPLRQRQEITVVLDRLRSAHNTGNIFRLAEALGAKEVICCGYTPCPPHPKLAKTAMGADAMVPSRSFPTALDAIRALREETPGIEILAVEPLPEAVDAWEYPYRFPIALIFGNEALGISPEALEAADAAVGLPMFGEKASINVGNCAAVVLYAAASKFPAVARR